MNARRPAGRTATGEELRFQGAVCDPCGEVFPKAELSEDRLCDACGPLMQRRMRWWRHVVAGLITLPFAVWIVVWTGRFPQFDYLPPLAWLLPLSASYYLGFRIGGEVVKGYTRWRRGR